MKLPGGLLLDGQLRQDFAFRPVTGDLERLIAESGYRLNSLAEQITAILALALEHIANIPANPELTRSLSSGDRQYLMHQLEAQIYPDSRWMTVACTSCNEAIQFQLIPGSFPIKPAGKHFPSRSLQLSVGAVSLRVPNGADEELAASSESEEQAVDQILQRLISTGQQHIDSRQLTDEDLDKLDTALDDMACQLGNSVSVQCPYCGLQQEVLLDHYRWISRQPDELDTDIHTLAFHYHWPESEILQLPRQRRKRYIQLIEQQLGKYRDDDLIQQVQGESR